MEHNSLLPSAERRRILRRTRRARGTAARMEVKAGSLQNLFKIGLKELASTLNRELSCSVRHYDCVMKIKITAPDSELLFMNFLNRAVDLTHVQKAVFCHLYVEEFTQNKLVGQIYGCWYDHLDLHIKSVSDCTLTNNPNDHSWISSVTFDL